MDDDKNHSEAEVVRFEHVIITRFNVRFAPDSDVASLGLDPEWLENRFSLFDRYCLSSIENQTNQNFSWILLFDEETPTRYRQRAEELSSKRPHTYPIFRKTFPLQEIQQIVSSVIRNNPDWLLSTRLDNDDGLNAKFVELLQSSVSFIGPEILNIPDGIILNGYRAYRHRDESNAFISLFEPYQGFETVLGIKHHVYASESHPVRQIGQGPLWLQVIHSGNISNRIRGRRIDLNLIEPGFPAIDSIKLSAPKPDPFVIAFENATFFCARSLRDAAARIVRKTARAFGLELFRKVRSARRLP